MLACSRPMHLETRQECPLEETPVERLKRAFQEFTETFESSQ